MQSVLAINAGVRNEMSAPQITLYKDSNFGGRAVPLTTCGSGNLGVDYNFNDQTSSIVVTSGIWLVYDDANFGGASYVLRPGEYSSPDQWGGKNDAISSVRPLAGNPGDAVIMLFADADYGGRMVAFTQSLSNFSTIDFNDTASSAIILGDTWYLYKDANFSGTTWPVNPTSGPAQNGYVPQPGSTF
jgi:hypothetical protein